MRNPEQTIRNMIDKASLSFLGSVDEDGFPNTKAMLRPRERQGIRHIYFSTNTSSMRVGQFLQNPKACVYFCDKRFYRGVMLLGTIEVLTGIDVKERLWHVGDRMYYPLGVTDPDYCVLKFTAHKGRYYSNMKSEDFVVEN